MSVYTATVIDTSGIQPYIFGSNRLRENIGASFLVGQATGDWVEAALRSLEAELRQAKVDCKIAYIPPKTTLYAPPQIQQDPQIAAELIYTGGGNAIAVFCSCDYAVRFTQILSRRVLEEAPGLTLNVAHQKFEWNEPASLFKAVQQLRHTLEYEKPPKAPSSPMLGLSVTADCISTRLVAVGMSNKFGAPEADAYLVSREVSKKIQAVNQARVRLREELKHEVPEDLHFPTDFDDLGRSHGESSYIAVVHADGNNMGARFEQCGKDKSNHDYIIAIRKLSSSVNHASLLAIRSVTKQLVNFIQIAKFPLPKRNEGGSYLPFRPLVYGGDDVTFVCDGRLGLELAALYLEEFAKQKDPDGNLTFSACAGIAIVKTHYPFARTYALSEILCNSAKVLLRQKEQETGREETNPKQKSAMDWHIATSGLLGSISEIRQREYRSEQRNALLMRPVWLSHRDEWQTWEGLKHVIHTFVHDVAWRDHKNKVIALREVLRRESNAVEQFLQVYKLDHLPTFTIRNGKEKTLQKKGWVDSRCGYFDAIEAMDFYTNMTEDIKITEGDE